MLPKKLVLVRHGESEGNVAVKASKAGDHSHYTEAFRDKHSSLWQLTETGIQQAFAAGNIIKAEVAGSFDRYYTSEYVRAQQTAAWLGFHDARWYTDSILMRERDRGEFDVLSSEDIRIKYEHHLRLRKIDPFFWTPPGGESMATLCLRIREFMDTLHRECSDKTVIVVCHGEVMWATRIVLEKLTRMQYHDLDTSSDPTDRIHNCQVLEYTRADDDRYYKSLRSLCTTDMSLSKTIPIVRPVFSNADLLRNAQSMVNRRST